MSPVAVRLFNQACPPNKTGFVANAYLMALFGGAGSLDYRYYSLKLVTISLSCKLTRMEVDYIIISVATIVLFVNSNSTIFTIAHHAIFHGLIDCSAIIFIPIASIGIAHYDVLVVY